MDKANVVQTDVAASNGVIHMIDIVLARVSHALGGAEVALFFASPECIFLFNASPFMKQCHAALDMFPIRPMGIREAIAAALRNEDHELAQTRWSDALSAANPKRDWGGVRFGNRIVDTRTITVAEQPAAVFAVIERIGGSTGWYFGNTLCQLRGWLDLIAGGVGIRRGRRDAKHLLPGDMVDSRKASAKKSRKTDSGRDQFRFIPECTSA